MQVASRVEVLAHDKEKEGFWMRDPKTGNWIPENHFGDIDVAELREKLLSRNTNKLKTTLFMWSSEALLLRMLNGALAVYGVN